MKNTLLTFSFVILASLINIQWANAIDQTVVGKKVSLISNDGTITYIKLKNTHTRSYKKDPFSRQFTLKEDVEGVLWKVLCVGVKMDKPFEKIILQDEHGTLFVPATNYLETSGGSRAFDKKGNIIYEGPTTSFFVAGPTNSNNITIRFGSSSAKIVMRNK